jgi:hypothetical protein
VRHSWTAETIEHALRLAVDIPSYRRAAESFEALTHVSLSKSSLEELVGEYGTELVEQEAQEAAALAPGGVGETWESPAAAGETMAVSLDGVMMNVRGEGWKEVKVASFSVVEVEAVEGKPEPEVRLRGHSYCAGLWEAPVFKEQQWAEGWRRGIQRAQRIVAVSDAALWIWNLIATCYAPCVQIIDWWHALQHVWAIVFAAYDPGSEAAQAWGVQLKEYLWSGRIRTLFQALRERWPRGEEWPEALHQAVGYLFRQRRRLNYQAFRQAGYPVGSGTVESACKVVVQERLVQAGMRWSRPCAQALLALRCALLSGRWTVTWRSLVPAKVT